MELNWLWTSRSLGQRAIVVYQCSLLLFIPTTLYSSHFKRKGRLCCSKSSDDFFRQCQHRNGGARPKNLFAFLQHHPPLASYKRKPYIYMHISAQWHFGKHKSHFSFFLLFNTLLFLYTLQLTLLVRTREILFPNNHFLLQNLLPNSKNKPEVFISFILNWEWQICCRAGSLPSSFAPNVAILSCPLSAEESSEKPARTCTFCLVVFQWA